jgi:alkylhydroperoxidase family enzyme
MMTRIPYRDAESMTDEARALTLERGNLNVYRALANAEKTFTGWMIAGREQLTSPVISPRLRELVILRTGHLMDSRYEVAQHVGVAEQVGVSAAQIAALAPDGDLDGAAFDDTELAILRLTTDLLTTKKVSAELFERVHGALGDEATVELLMIIHRWAGLALMLNALEVDIDTAARISIPERDSHACSAVRPIRPA